MRHLAPILLLCLATGPSCGEAGRQDGEDAPARTAPAEREAAEGGLRRAADLVGETCLATASRPRSHECAADAMIRRLDPTYNGVSSWACV